MKLINKGGKNIYHNGIIHTDEFIKLYHTEKPIAKFSLKVVTDTARPFMSLLSIQRKSLRLKENDVLLLRVIKKDKEIEFISKMYEWGKIHIPKKIVNLLDIKNKEKVDFQIISKDNTLKTSNDRNLDVSKIMNEKIKVIPRANNMITVYSKHKIPITVPRFIKFSPELFELFFLIHGDGHYKTKLFFVNKTPELIQFVMEQFENILKIPKDEWRARIVLSDLNTQNKVKEFWKNKLSLKEHQFYSISKTKFNTAKYGNLRIIIDKTIVPAIFRFIFDKLKKKLNGVNSFYALNGLLCAEGGAQIGNMGLHKITLSFNKEENLLFEEILNKTDLLDICKIEQGRTYSIERWNNLYTFFRIFLLNNIVPFKYHNQRKEDALNGFLTHSFTNTMLKYLSILKEKGKLNVKEFSDLLGIRKDSLLDTIRKKQYNQFIKIEGRGIRNGPFIFSITDKGKLFLEVVNKMENLLKQQQVINVEVGK